MTNYALTTYNGMSPFFGVSCCAIKREKTLNRSDSSKKNGAIHALSRLCFRRYGDEMYWLAK
jgi:hypothetical protein